MKEHHEAGSLVHIEDNDVAVPMVIVRCRKYEGKLSDRISGFITDLRELTDEERVALSIMES